MAQPLKVILVENDAADAELVIRGLERAGYELDCTVVETEADFLARLNSGTDLILSDYALPQFSGMRALELLRRSGRDTPFIIVSGTIGEDVAVEAMKQGATDYLLKDRLARLGPSVARALEQYRLRRERNEAEAAIRESQASLSAAQEIGKFGSWELDLAQSSEAGRKPLKWSAQCYRIFGYAPGEVEVTSELFYERVHPEDREAIRAAVARAIAKHERYLLDHRIVLGSGEVRHVREAGLVFYEPAGERPMKIVGTVHDITEERRADAAVREAHAKLHHLVARSPTVIYQLEVSGATVRLHFVSENIEALTGHTVDEALTTGWWRDHLDPRDRTAVAAAMQQTMNEGASRVEYRFRHRNGTLVWLEDRKRLLPATGDGPREIVGGWTDISARKAAEELARETEDRFRRMAETIDEVFWMAGGATGPIVYVSPAFERLSGCPCADVLGQRKLFAEVIYADDRPTAAAVLEARLAGRPFEHEFGVLRADGTWRTVSERGYPVRDGEGLLTHYVGVVQDLTERRLLEEQYRQAQKMEAVGTLAGGIAHDFNNILSAINGYAQLARASLDGSHEAAQFLGEVERAGARAADLIKQILAFSRHHEHRRVPLALQPIVAESIKLLRATIPSTIQFAVRLPSAVQTVRADPTQVHQIVMNLVTNAWHAMRDQPGRLEVRLEDVQVDAALTVRCRDLRPGPYVRLTVADDGHGMTATTRARIFEPFFTTKPPGQGTGLGLAVVHGIMRAHEGAVTVESEVGVGTTFRLYFPAEGGAVAAEATAPGALPRGQGECVMVIDDEETLTRLTRKILEKLGYQVETFNRAYEALEALQAEPQRYQLAISDQTMPHLTGLDFAECALKLRPDLPIILTSGYNAQLTAERVAAVGVRAVLAKPTSREDLALAVWRALHESTVS